MNIQESPQDYVSRNWDEEVERVAPVSGCNCKSCSLHKQLESDFDKAQEAEAEFRRHLAENRLAQKAGFMRYMRGKNSPRLRPHPAERLKRRNRKTA